MFWEQENLGGHKRNLGGTALECTPVATGLIQSELCNKLFNASHVSLLFEKHNSIEA